MTTIEGEETVEATWATGTQEKVLKAVDGKIRGRNLFCNPATLLCCLQGEGGEEGEGGGGLQMETLTMMTLMGSTDR